MAENHYVDSKDQHEAATGVADHSDLTTFYASKKEEVLGPWMQEKDRQAALKKERDKIQTGLRKSSVLIGLNITLPVILGILLGQLAMARSGINPADAMAMEFLLLFLLAALVGITYALFKWVGKTFHNHTVQALPIIFTTLLCLLLVIQKVFNLSDGLVGGLVGYGAALVALLVIGILIATITIFVWTSPKLPRLVALLVLLVFLGGAVAVFYLA